MSQEPDSKRKGGWWSSLVGTDAAVEAARIEAETVHKSLTTELTRLEDALDEANQTLAKRDERIETIDAELRNTRQTAATLLQNNNELRRQLDATEYQLRAQREQFDSQRKVLEEREFEAGTARALLEQELARVRAEVDSVRALVGKESEAKVERAVAELLELKRKGEAERTASAQREKAASDRAAEASRSIAALKAELDTSAIELVKERDRTRTVEAELDKLRARAAELERLKNDALKAQTVASEAQRMSEAARWDAEQKSTRMQESQRSLESQIAELVKSKDDVERSNVTLAQQLVAERAKVTAVESATATTRTELANARAAVLTHEKSLSTARAEATERGKERDEARRALSAAQSALAEAQTAKEQLASAQRMSAALTIATTRALRAIAGPKAALALRLIEREGEGVSDAIASLERALQ